MWWKNGLRNMIWIDNNDKIKDDNSFFWRLQNYSIYNIIINLLKNEWRGFNLKVYQYNMFWITSQIKGRDPVSLISIGWVDL